MTDSDRLFPNPRADRGAAYGEVQREALDPAQAEDARRAVASWPDYAPAPLRSLAALARSHGLASIHYKDERGRFGLGSFKPLGAGLAVERALEASLDVDGPRPVVSCASSGNQGVAVAWAARHFGCDAVIYVGGDVPAERKEAMRHFDAEVVEVRGRYVAAVERAWADAREHGRIMITDAHLPASGSPIPPALLQGYTTSAAEALAQLDGPPTHLFLQAGTGGFAAAFYGYLWDELGPDRPALVVVEPDAAACCFESARAGEPVTLDAVGDTAMRGLATARPSAWAWKILGHADFFLRIPDEAAVDAADALRPPHNRRKTDEAAAEPPPDRGPTTDDGRAGEAEDEASARDQPAGRDPFIETTPTGAAGLAGLLFCAERPALRQRLGLDGARVLVVGTESAAG